MSGTGGLAVVGTLGHNRPAVASRGKEGKRQADAVHSGAPTLDVFGQPPMPGSNADKRFRVPDEDIRLTQYEVEVIQTRQFQRLFDLRKIRRQPP